MLRADRPLIALVRRACRRSWAADSHKCTGPGPRWHWPRASIDLLVLALGWFYEQDRSVNFWHLDELLRRELGTTAERFQTELRAVLGL